MTFKLSLEEYGIEILKVRELIRLMHITQVPGTSEFVRGVINLRGKIIPVIDLKRKFGMGSLEETDQTVVIVVQYVSQDRLTTMGILVDEVLEVVSIAADQIEPPPDFGVGCVDVEFILGVGKADRRVILMLDIGKVLTAEETRRLGQTAAS
ncbi:MAG TPA: chemotaxis protein CheW [Myxococcota bacterium]|nr:chemotaxis protein CheW [Myxococcota bacterium]HRY96252.1 chemotaxis protein CheW [Myxococcota bacterium]HSA20457.1 chemotaxis protein CheW [Myxococcota bacterium]